VTITRKTGCLFSLATARGTMTAAANGGIVTTFTNFDLSAGKEMGIADDITGLHAPRDGHPGSEALLFRFLPSEETTASGRR
jgi:geranylgeranyl diphosphate synthase type II